MGECGKLIASLNRVLLRGHGSQAEVAAEIASVEIMCSQLRLIVGSELVDIEKVEKLAELQARLRASEI